MSVLGVVVTGMQTYLVFLREWLLYVVSHIVSWSALSASPDHFRRSQLKQLPRGEKTVKWMQTFRTPFLDNFFNAVTCMGDSDFYQTMLPPVFWNGGHELGRYTTYVVLTGLLAGNVLKDIFRLPRPRISEGVWREKAAARDSTSCLDYGWPSTHAMNALTNPVVVLGYLLYNGHLTTERPVILVLSLLYGVLHTVALTVSRLYLGAHSPGDVRGGLSLGFIILAFAVSTFRPFDDWVHTAPAWQVYIGTVLGAAIVLLACPQPRPRTPTFLGSTRFVGLFTGMVLGTRMYHDRVGASLVTTSSPVVDMSAVDPWVAGLLRTVVGLVFVLAVKEVNKVIMRKVITAVMGVDPKRPEFDDPVPPKVVAKEAPAGSELTPIPTDGLDITRCILAQCLWIVGSYTLAATCIAHTVPILQEGAGLV